MVVAILVALIVVVVAVLAIVAFFMLRARGGNTRVTKSVFGKVNSIDPTSVNTALTSEDASDVPATHVQTAKTASGKISEKLESRFIAIGVLAAGIFGTLTARLFGMQVLGSSEYEESATENKYTTVSTPAPRGYIYDADGVVLVGNRTSLTVLSDADVIDDRDVMLRLSAVLGVPYNVVRTRLQDTSSGAQSQRVIASDARLRDVAFIAEHSDAFSGVTVQERAVRTYPYGALCSHVVGYTGTVSEDSLANMPSNRTVELGDDVGQSGIESIYDNYLAGEHGQRVVMADAEGNVVEVVSETPATRGSDVYLTIKAHAQYVAETALKELIAPNNIIGEGTGVAGAVVALDCTDGSILCMANYPTFSPATFIGGISQDTWDLYASEASYYPLLNRCISGTYPAASTFKSFTSLAALKYGFATDKTTWDCGGSWDGFGSGDIQKCWNAGGHGTLDLEGGIVNSCDIVFYEIAKDFYYAGTSQGGTISDTALQEEVLKYGFGQKTGIDLSGEEIGRVPTPEWKSAHWVDVPTAGMWMGGDMTNMIIGQGDVLVTPLQVAVAYGGIATGQLMKPHLLKEVRNDTATAAVTFKPEVIATPDVKEDYLKLVRTALNGVAVNGTFYDDFIDAGIDINKVACKTGTGEVAGKEDYAWFVCYYPLESPKYVVSVLIEQGGGGSATAGPIAARVLGAIVDNETGEDTSVGVVAASSGKSVEYGSGGSSSGRTD